MLLSIHLLYGFLSMRLWIQRSWFTATESFNQDTEKEFLRKIPSGSAQPEAALT
jgi:hypothetical protein